MQRGDPHSCGDGTSIGRGSPAPIARTIRDVRRPIVRLLVLASVVAAVIGAWLFVRARLRTEIEQRCSAALSATCEIDALSLRTDGATASGVHVVASLGAVQSDIDAIEADFQWLPLLTGQSQSVAVRVKKPAVREALPVGNVGLAFGNMGEGKRPDGTPSSITVDHLTVEGGDVQVKVTLVAEVHVQAIAVEWKAKGPLEIRWDDASFDSLLAQQSTGACTVRTPPGSHVADVACPSVKTKLDLDRVKSLADLAKVFLKLKLPT